MKHTLLLLIIIFYGLSFDRLNIFKYTIISSIIHECGHIIGYRIINGKMPSVRFSVFGVIMQNNVSLHRKYTFILFSGPFRNLVCALISYMICRVNFSFKIYTFMLVNGMIFFFNMLPVFFLDGGQILYSKSRGYQQYYKETSMITIVFVSVMLYYFTHSVTSILLFIIYFIANLINDI